MSPRKEPEVTGAHAEALRALTAALVRLAEQDQQPPCTGDSRFISDELEVMLAAARLCAGCPVIGECRAVGQFEKWGVWGAVVKGGNQPLGRKAKEKSA